MYRTVAGSPLRSVSTSRSRAENVESFKTGTRRFDCLVASRLARVGTQPSIKPPCNDHRHPNHLRSANSGPRNRSALGMNPAPAQCVQHLENSRCNQQLRHDRTALLRCIRSRDPTRSGLPKTCGWPLPYTRIWWLGTELNRIHWPFRPALCRRVPEPNLVDGARLELAFHGCRP